jgi:hypothetical protein
VQNAACVCEGNSFTDAKNNSQAVWNRSNRLNVFVEAPALDEFHGVEDAAIGEGSHIVNGHDAGMLESREDASFADQAIGEIAVGSWNIEDF